MLLYEPGTAGHRPVILRYTQKILDRAGVGWVHEARDLRGSALSLIEAARRQECDVIYIMTLETLAWFAWKVSWLAWAHGIRVICTYYLFNNLREGWKSLAWRAMLIASRIHFIFISDHGLQERLRRYPSRVRYLPDPWDREEFREWSQESARAELGLPFEAVVFLMFGGLDERKGADRFLFAIEHFGPSAIGRPVVFLLAGIASDAIRSHYNCMVDTLPKGVCCVLHDKFIPEEMVSCYFYATDYVVTAYPEWFKVSSGGVTRALAAGRPLIVPDHGVNAELVQRLDVGYVFNYAKKQSLSDRLRYASRLRLEDPHSWMMQCGRSGEAGKSRRLDWYGKYLTTYLAENVIGGIRELP